MPLKTWAQFFCIPATTPLAMIICGVGFMGCDAPADHSGSSPVAQPCETDQECGPNQVCKSAECVELGLALGSNGSPVDPGEIAMLPDDNKGVLENNDNPPDGLPGEKEEVERFMVGTGNEVFEALPEGSEVELISGVQGGYHVWGAFRAHYLQVNESVMLTYALTVDAAVAEELNPDSPLQQLGDQFVVGAIQLEGDLEPQDDGHTYAYVSAPVYISYAFDIRLLDGKKARLWGALASGTPVVWAVRDSADVTLKCCKY